MKRIVFKYTVFLFLLLIVLELVAVGALSASTTFCKIYEWSCDDDTCIDDKLRCNGAVDCPDGSDETFLLCRNNRCPGFSCVYGGCVASDAVCNGVKDCADNSDELLLQCRNETTYTECSGLIPIDAPDYTERWQACELKGRTCKDGQVLEDFAMCNGRVDCQDKSDETLEMCSTHGPNCKGDRFRCKYGGCIEPSAVCNDVYDCVDGSDELKGLCGRFNDDDSKWTCEDGSRISSMQKCNGALDCPDGSDETFLLCRETQCPVGMRKCVYGGCVKNSAICNGVKDCADNSDELLLECRNEKTYGQCVSATVSFLAPNFNEKLKECQRLDKTCKNGQTLSFHPKCDGKVHCNDGSDETLETCATDRRDCVNYYGGGIKFRCRYGGCIDQVAVCNGVKDCADGSDELHGLCNKVDDKKVWTCGDGTQISATSKCNGAVDCPDGSDETFLLCRHNVCPLGFRCVYGGCVNNSVSCNGVKDCADNSDELLAKCRNEPTFISCFSELLKGKIPSEKSKRDEQLKTCNDLEKMCKNGQILSSAKDFCNGKVDCEDKSDETLENCSTDRYMCNSTTSFRCENGACIDLAKVCNRVKDCADGSNELDGLCFKGKCVLPEYPKNGNYVVIEKPNAHPGQALDSALLVFTCDSQHKLYGTSLYVNCLRGAWPYDPPKCLSQCHLQKHPTIAYWCLPRGPLASEEEQECQALVPDGATVRPVCSESIYQYNGVLDFMHCVDGQWDSEVPTCTTQCGRVTQEANHLIINGTSAKRGELPWHAAIYDKTKTPHEQICGGSLISNTIIISAAHCFWSDWEKLLPPGNYAAAVGKLYRPWGDPNEVDPQKFNVKDIKVPPRFKGSTTSFQEDIALVILATPAVYRTHVLPICIDFGNDFENEQLATGNVGKVAGWGLTAEDGKASGVLKVAELPYVDIDQCFAESPPSFYNFITGDKFCAGSSNSAALCKGDSGGGLVFAYRKGGEPRYFLRGIVSTAPRNDHACNAFALTTFTKISRHKDFILENWN